MASADNSRPSIPTNVARAIYPDMSNPVEVSHVYQPRFIMSECTCTRIIPHTAGVTWTNFRYFVPHYPRILLGFRFYIPGAPGSSDIVLCKYDNVSRSEWTELEWPIPSVNGEIHVDITYNGDVESSPLPINVAFDLVGFTGLFGETTKYVYRDVNYHACIEIDTIAGTYRDVMADSFYDEGDDAIIIRHTRWYIENASRDSSDSD